MKKQIIASIGVGLLVVCTVSADDALPPEQIRAGEAKQTQIKAQTQNVAAQLGAIIDEFKRNGLDGQDVEVLEAIRRVLGKLSDQEMKKVIDALQEARSAADASQSKKAFAGAVSDQKAIIAQLRALLLEYQRQQALYELSLRLAALAERENANLKTVVDLAKMTGNATASRFDDTQRASLQIQAADQQGLKDEVTPLLTKIETLTKDADGATKDRLNKAMEQVKSGGLKPAMDSAIEDLKSAALYRAAGSEKIIRDQLRELARLVAPPKDALGALQAALKEIEKQIEAEKAIVEQTRKMDKQNAAELENRQADVVDRTDAIKNDLAQLAPDASGELKNAQNQMQEARANISEQRRTEALKSEALALDKLEAAKKALQEQIAKTEPQQKPEDKLAATKQLQERTKEMIKKEEEIKSATATAANQNKEKEIKALAPKQADVEEQTKDLSRDAAAQAPEAAQSIGEAAQQMDKSEKNLAKPQQQAKTAQEAQAAAISALKQAEEQLGKQAEQLEKAKQELADLMDSRAKIMKLIDGQQKVQLDTAKLAAKPDAKNTKEKNKAEVNYMAAEEAGIKASPTSSPISSPKDLSSPQDNLAKQTDQVKTELLESEKAAAQPLDDAKKNMVDAKGKLDANDAKRASPAQLEALVNLYKAKEALDKKIQDLQKQLGQEPQNMDANAAAQKIEQLQKDVAKANDQLNADPQQMQKSLQQQQKEIAQALQQMQKDAQQNGEQNAQKQQPLGEAQQAAQQAAQQLAQNNNNEALKSMQKAQQGIQQAMKAQPQKGQQQQGQPQKGQPQQRQPDQGQPDKVQPAQADAGQPGQGQPGQGQASQGQPGQGQPGQGQPGQGLPQLAQKQADLQKQLEQMMQGDPTQQAAAGLEQAAGEAGQMASGQQGQLPPGANQAMQQAAAALAQAAAAASGRDNQTAQEKAADAQAALAQAAAALSLAQAGLNGQMANAQGQQGQGQPGQGQQGQGQQQGKGQQQGQGQGQDQKGNGPNNPSRSTGNRNSIQGGSFSAALPNKDAKGNGQYQALPQRDRNAITQSRNEKYPEEYGPQVEQYLKNLADQEETGPAK